MTRLFLVRHGETDWNIERRHQGQSDIPLNENGYQQARETAARLKDVVLNGIYSSDLGRALVTAEAIADFHTIGINKDPRLREMSFGEWEGLTYLEIQQRKQMTAADWNRTMLETGPPGGESLHQFADRVKAAADEIIYEHPDDTVLVVSHGGTLMLLTCIFLEHPIEKYWQFRMDQASISEISTYPDGVIISLLNDTSHLKPLILIS